MDGERSGMLLDAEAAEDARDRAELYRARAREAEELARKVPKARSTCNGPRSCGASSRSCSSHLAAISSGRISRLDVRFARARRPFGAPPSARAPEPWLRSGSSPPVSIGGCRNDRKEPARRSPPGGVHRPRVGADHNDV